VSGFSPSHRGGSGEPLVLLHGFTDTWRTWELVLPSLERSFDVLAPTLAGHAGGPALDPVSNDGIVDAVDRAMDEAGFATAHLAGNSLGGHVALRLAARGRARSVVALAPAGGWAPGDESFREVLAYQSEMLDAVEQAAPHAEAILATPEGRRRATAAISERYEHIPAELLVHITRGAASAPAARDLIDLALAEGWPLDAERVDCPLRIVWGTSDRLLVWPRAAERWRAAFPHAEWIELDGVGHCPQLDVPLEAAELIRGGS
jgi:pimeloyl-ACP methyl ester carboxylesterase